MSDNSWAWVIKTPNIDLSISVCGPWTQAEAAKLVWEAFEEYKLPPIVGMLPRKRPGGRLDDHGVIYEHKGEMGFSAGRSFWVAAGRTAEFEAQMVLERKSDDQAP